MLFNSVEYIVLLALSLAAYWAPPWLRARQVVPTHQLTYPEET